MTSADIAVHISSMVYYMQNNGHRFDTFCSDEQSKTKLSKADAAAADSRKTMEKHCLHFLRDVAILYGSSSCGTDDMSPADILNTPAITLLAHTMLLSASIATPGLYALLVPALKVDSDAQLLQEEIKQINPGSTGSYPLDPPARLDMHESLLVAVVALCCGNWAMLSTYGNELMNLLGLSEEIGDNDDTTLDSKFKFNPVEALWLLVRGDLSVAAAFWSKTADKEKTMKSRLFHLLCGDGQSGDGQSGVATGNHCDAAESKQLVMLHRLATLDKLTTSAALDIQHEFVKNLTENNMLLRSSNMLGTPEVLVLLNLAMMLAMTGHVQLFSSSTLEELAMLLGVESGLAARSFAACVRLSDPFARCNLLQLQSMEKLGLKSRHIHLFVRSMQGHCWALQELASEVIVKGLMRNQASSMARLTQVGMQHLDSLGKKASISISNRTASYRRVVQTRLSRLTPKRGSLTLGSFTGTKNIVLRWHKGTQRSKEHLKISDLVTRTAHEGHTRDVDHELMTLYLHGLIAATCGNISGAVALADEICEVTKCGDAPSMFNKMWSVFCGYKALLEGHAHFTQRFFANATTDIAASSCHHPPADATIIDIDPYGPLLSGGGPTRALVSGGVTECGALLVQVMVALKCQDRQALEHSLVQDTAVTEMCFSLLNSAGHENARGDMMSTANWRFSDKMRTYMTRLLHTACGDTMAGFETLLLEGSTSGCAEKRNEAARYIPHVLATLVDPLGIRVSLESGLSGDNLQGQFQEGLGAILREGNRSNSSKAKKGKSTKKGNIAYKLQHDDEESILLVQAVLRGNGALHLRSSDVVISQHRVLQGILKLHGQSDDEKAAILELVNIVCFGVGQAGGEHDTMTMTADIQHSEKMLKMMLMAYQNPDHSILKRLLLTAMHHMVTGDQRCSQPEKVAPSGHSYAPHVLQIPDDVMRDLFNALLHNQNKRNEEETISQGFKSKELFVSKVRGIMDEEKRLKHVTDNAKIEIEEDMASVLTQAISGSKTVGDGVETVLLQKVLPKVVIQDPAQKDSEESPSSSNNHLETARVWVSLLFYITKAKQESEKDAERGDGLIQHAAALLVKNLGIPKTPGDVADFLKLLIAISRQNVEGALKANALQHVVPMQVKLVIKLLKATGSLHQHFMRAVDIANRAKDDTNKAQTFREMLHELNGRMDGEIHMRKLNELLLQLDFDFIDEQRVMILSAVGQDHKSGFISIERAMEPIKRQAQMLTLEVLEQVKMSWSHCLITLFAGAAFVLLIMLFLFLGIKSFSTCELNIMKKTKNKTPAADQAEAILKNIVCPPRATKSGVNDDDKEDAVEVQAKSAEPEKLAEPAPAKVVKTDAEAKHHKATEALRMQQEFPELGKE
eukprot:gene2565-3319_t